MSLPVRSGIRYVPTHFGQLCRKGRGGFSCTHAHVGAITFPVGCHMLLMHYPSNTRWGCAHVRDALDTSWSPRDGLGQSVLEKDWLNIPSMLGLTLVYSVANHARSLATFPASSARVWCRNVSQSIVVCPLPSRAGGADGEEDRERCAVLPQAARGAQRPQAGELVVGASGRRRRAAGLRFFGKQA